MSKNAYAGCIMMTSMRISDSLVEKLLKKTKKVTNEQLTTLKQQEQNEKKPLQDVVIAGNIVSEKELTQLFADEIEVPYVDINPKDIEREVLHQIPERIARQYNVVVFKVAEDGTKELAMEDPDDIQAISF